MNNITFSYTQNADSSWFGHFIHPQLDICKSLKSIRIERSYWFDDEGCFYLSHCENIWSLSMEKPYISDEGLQQIFEGCTKLQCINIFKGYFEDGLLNSLKTLAKHNKEMQRIELDFNGWEEEEEFDDEYLDVFMDGSACPQLKYLSLSNSISDEKQQEFATKRPNVELYTR